ncbi:MAG: hypothetical protein GX574_01630 [Lentisphaerae bacterium]|nr:hypothetical protein [Lentisphaerota bacterium]
MPMRWRQCYGADLQVRCARTARSDAAKMRCASSQRQRPARDAAAVSACWSAGSERAGGRAAFYPA